MLYPLRGNERNATGLCNLLIRDSLLQMQRHADEQKQLV
jgi:hypothetical protein